MVAFGLGEHFLLSNETARRLYHEVASQQAIFDYHCHLPVQEIAGNRRFANLSQIWLEGDHYKWRALRTLGVGEHLITGSASDYEKFSTWMTALPRCVGSPLYHWSHLEMRRPFGIDGIALGPDCSDQVWQQTEALLAQPEFSARGIMQQMNVSMIGTTDDPVDSLVYHRQLAEDDSFAIDVLPTFRPDRAFKIDAPDFAEYIEQLESASGLAIACYADFCQALLLRLDHFDAHGCRSADHGIEVLYFRPLVSEEVLDKLIARRRLGQVLSTEEVGQFATAVQVFLAREYRLRHWVMQLHIGAMRNVNSALFSHLGPNAGGDSIGDLSIARQLGSLLDLMNHEDGLPKTILYCLNPRHNEVLATMAGNFQKPDTEAHVQLGAAWWFNDQRDGMEEHLRCLANYGVLSTFVGMLTDSRSFLSYTRHEYYRRILCNMLGVWVEAGEMPADPALLRDLVERLCGKNTQTYFQLDGG